MSKRRSIYMLATSTLVWSHYDIYRSATEYIQIDSNGEQQEIHTALHWSMDVDSERGNESDAEARLSTLQLSTQTVIGGMIIDEPQADPFNEPSVFSIDKVRRRPYEKLSPKSRPQFIPPIENRPSVNYGNNNNNASSAEAIRITINTDELEKSPLAQTYSAQIDELVNNIIPGSVNLWADKLNVVPVADNLFPSGPTCGEATIPANDIANGVAETDLIIYVVGKECNAVGNGGIYAYAGPCEYDQFVRPIIGYMVVCLDDIGEIQPNGALSAEDTQKNTYVQVHELTRILGFSMDLLEYYTDITTNETYGATEKEVTCTDGSVETLSLPNNVAPTKRDGITYYQITTHSLVQVARNHFNCQDEIFGVQLSPAMGGSCIGEAYWAERFIRDDLMTPLNENKILNLDANSAITPFTLALLEDSGWYKLEFTKANNMVFGYGAGCGFVSSKCIDGGEIPSYSNGHFCTDIIPFTIGGVPSPLQTKYGCDIDHRNKAVCDLVDYSQPPISSSGQDPPPVQFQYFPSPSLGAFYNIGADYCPMRETLLSIDCTDDQQESHFAFDAYGPDSRCFETVGVLKPVCIDASCNPVTGKIEGFLLNLNTTFVCENEGQIIDYTVEPPNESFQFICPRAAQFCEEVYCPRSCSGRGICEFDAVPFPKCACANSTDNSVDCSASPIITAASKSESPSSIPSFQPSNAPSLAPSFVPSTVPSVTPSVSPTARPSTFPSMNPTAEPSDSPSDKPSLWPTVAPTYVPTTWPTARPSVSPTVLPSTRPTATPSTEPSKMPSSTPSATPSLNPSSMPSCSPSVEPTAMPSQNGKGKDKGKKKSGKKSSKSAKKKSSKSIKSKGKKVTGKKSLKSAKKKSSKSKGHGHSQSVSESVKHSHSKSRKEGHDSRALQYDVSSKCTDSSPTVPPILMPSSHPSVSMVPTASMVPSIFPTRSALPTTTTYPSSAPQIELSALSAPTGDAEKPGEEGAYKIDVDFSN